MISDWSRRSRSNWQRETHEFSRFPSAIPEEPTRKERRLIGEMAFAHCLRSLSLRYRTTFTNATFTVAMSCHACRAHQNSTHGWRIPFANTAGIGYWKSEAEWVT